MKQLISETVALDKAFDTPSPYLHTFSIEIFSRWLLLYVRFSIMRIQLTHIAPAASSVRAREMFASQQPKFHTDDENLSGIQSGADWLRNNLHV